jgi:hypothetical protein
MSFTCPECRRTSYHPVDEQVGWCGACEAFTRDTPQQTEALAAKLISEGQPALAAHVRRRLAKGQT